MSIATMIPPASVPPSPTPLRALEDLPGAPP